MATEIRVPTTGNAGEDAILSDLRATAGVAVREGDVVAVLETAKASLEVVSPVSGVVLDVRAHEGDEVAEFSILLVVGEPGEVVPERSPEGDLEEVGVPSTSSPELPQAGVGRPAVEAAISGPEVRVLASPRAKLLASRNRIDIAGLRGSGPGGRVIVPDVLAAKTGATSTPEPAGKGYPDPQSGASEVPVIVPVRGARKITAKRMAQSSQEAAPVTLNRYAPADRLLSFNQRLRRHTEEQGVSKISINDIVNFAVAKTLPDYPALNSLFSWDGIEQYRCVNLGIAVDTGSALLVPVIRSAHTLSLLELAEATRFHIQRARNGQFEMSDMDHGTFTVTNLGMFGIHWFTPVLNPPQSGILGVGAIHQPTSNQPALLPLSLTFDHRSLDGAEAAKALQAICDAIDNIDVISALSASI